MTRGVSRQVQAGTNDFAVQYKRLPLKPERTGSDLKWWQWQREDKMERDNRVVCGARRRRDGQPCQALSVPGKKRCKWHGGCSTGPTTPEGKAKCAEALRRWRASKNGRA